MLVLAVESSTSSAKALLYDTKRGIVKTESLRYPPEIDKDGMTDTEGVFQATMQVARKAAEGKPVEAVALCGTWHSLAACDKKLTPRAPTFSWNFLGAADICREMRRDTALAHKFYTRTGCMPHSVYVRHSLQYLKSQGFDYSDCLLASQGGYAFYKLTGERFESVSTQCGTGFVDVHALRYDDFALNYFGVKASQLGTMVTYREARPLNEYGAALMGIKAGIPVVPAHPDGALNQVGNYANRPGIMTLSIGTSGALRISVSRPILPDRAQLWCYYGVNSWMSGAAISGACNCIDWFRDTYLGKKWSFAELETEPEPNRDTPVCLPFMFGERNPGWHDDARGGFYDLKAGHTIQDMYRALQMGILFNLYDCYRILCREDGVPDKIIVSGGGVNSKLWTQMLADIFKKDLLVAQNPNASSIGAVALALNAAGALDDVNAFRTDFDSAVKFSPNPELYGYYDRQFERYRERYSKELP